MPYSNITITTNSGLSFRQYDFIQVTHDSDNYIIGRVVSYNSSTGQLTFTPLVVRGSGSFSTWEVTLTGDPGMMEVAEVVELQELRVLPPRY